MVKMAQFILAVVIGLSVEFVAAAEDVRLAPELQKQKSIRQNKHAGAEVLHAIKKTRVDSNYTKTSTQYYSIRINDADAARDYGRISIRYSHFYSNIELQFANVLGPDGKLKALSADAQQKKVGGSQDFYDESSRLVFSLPDVSPGSIIEFQYVSHQIKQAIPNFFSDNSGNSWYQPTASGRSGRFDYVHKALYELTLDKSLPLEVERLGPAKNQYKKRSKDGIAIHRWTWKKQLEIPVEPSMPWYELLMSRVSVSSTRDWAELDQWMWELVHDKFYVTAEIQKIADSLAKQNATKQEKIRAVYAYLQNKFRYVYAHLGRGGYEPHFAADTVSRLYGDCKDQTVLAVALLNALGVEALPALVVTPRAGHPNMNLVALYFDHMIVWIPDEGNDGTWMDTTAERFLYPGISNALLDQPAFILNGDGGHVTTIARVEYPNHATVNLDYRLSKGHLVAEMKVTLAGILEQHIRNWWLHQDDRETALHTLVKVPFSTMGAESKISAELINADRLWQPVSLTATIDFGPITQNDENHYDIGSNVNQVLALFGEFDSMPLPQARRGPWVSLHELSLQLNVSMESSAEFTSSLIHSALDFSNRYFEVRQSATRENSGFSISMDYQRNRVNLDADEYEQFYLDAKALMSAASWNVRFERNNALISGQDLSLVTPKDSQDTAAHYLARARQLIETAQFEAAEAASREAIAINENNGEAWYVLGVVMGFQANLSSAEVAFNKAKKLGFQP